MCMYIKGHTETNIDIDKIHLLPYQRDELPDGSVVGLEAKNYPKELIADSICSDLKAEENNLDWGWTNQYRIKEWKICALSFYKLSPGHITPWHKDHYKSFTKCFNVDKNKVVRRMMFLEPWQPGQFFCIERETITNWIPGDWVQWTTEHRHMGANHSNVVRYTLQLTGIEYE